MSKLTPTPNEKLVSIVMPAYNCADFIGVSIESVMSQDYSNWELIIVDDCSKDSTKEVIHHYIEKDQRVQYVSLDTNSGAAVARNKAVELSKGEYIAFLDSDDIWYPSKLSKQISFMEKRQVPFTFTSYDVIDESGQTTGEVVKARSQVTYRDLLRKGVGNLTVIYNASILGKTYIPNIRKRNDYVMWLSVIKKAKVLHGLSEPLAGYRIRSGSLSRNKADLLKYQWKVYHEIEKLSFIYSGYLVLRMVFVTVFKIDQ